MIAVVLLWLAVLGFPVPLRKVAFGPEVDWIGARFQWTADGVRFTVPAKRRDEVLVDEAEKVLRFDASVYRHLSADTCVRPQRADHRHVLSIEVH